MMLLKKCQLVFVLLVVCIVESRSLKFISGLFKPNSVFEATPVVKSPGVPVLSLRHRSSGNRITLIGVSHGSEASAALVEERLRSIKPDYIIVELCEDRYLSISLESKIEPTFNNTLKALYKNKLKLLEEKQELLLSSGTSQGPLSKVLRVSNFAWSQGLFGGLFVLLGLLISALQKSTRENGASDEFVTSMRIAAEQRIPIYLGDAPQNETLKSIQKIFTLETFNPKRVSEGGNSLMIYICNFHVLSYLLLIYICKLHWNPIAVSLAFSSLGLFPTFFDSFATSSAIDRAILSASNWVNIPLTYLESKKMWKSVLPILLISTVPTLIGSVAVGDVSMVVDASVTSATSMNSLASFYGSFFEPLENIIDLLSLLVLVRMAKLIGADRDIIIAEKVDAACRNGPRNADVVVVIGMLHCNGVARRLLAAK